jgi:hypothetical protein
MSKPADTTDFIAIHTCLRRGGRALAIAVRTLDVSDRPRVDALRRYWDGYTGEVLAHHTVEDDIFYPALVERAPEAAEHLGRIDAEHHLLDELMAEGHAAMTGLVEGASTEGAAYVLGHLDRTMQEHLDYEEVELLPLFSRNFDQDEYEQLHKAAIKSVGLGKQAMFTVPFIASWVDDDQRAQLLGSAPLPFRIMYRLTRRSHERLATEALGTARQHVSAAALERVA